MKYNFEDSRRSAITFFLSMGVLLIASIPFTFFILVDFPDFGLLYLFLLVMFAIAIILPQSGIFKAPVEIETTESGVIIRDGKKGVQEIKYSNMFQMRMWFLFETSECEINFFYMPETEVKKFAESMSELSTLALILTGKVKRRGFSISNKELAENLVKEVNSKVYIRSKSKKSEEDLQGEIMKKEIFLFMLLSAVFFAQGGAGSSNMRQALTQLEGQSKSFLIVAVAIEAIIGLALAGGCAAVYMYRLKGKEKKETIWLIVCVILGFMAILFLGGALIGLISYITMGQMIQGMTGVS